MHELCEAIVKQFSMKAWGIATMIVGLQFCDKVSVYYGILVTLNCQRQYELLFECEIL